MMDLLRFMLCSQVAFVEKRIYEPNNSKAFKEQALQLIALTTEKSNNLDTFKLGVNLAKIKLDDKKPNYIVALFSDDYKYKMLAIELAEDIASSIDTRFVSGGSKAYLGLLPEVKFIC
jgi:hypothetical protein